MSLLVFAATFITLSEKGQGDWRMGDGQGLGLPGLLGQKGVKNHVRLGWDAEGHEAGEGAVGVVGRWAIHRHGAMTRSTSEKGSEGMNG